MKIRSFIIALLCLGSILCITPTETKAAGWSPWIDGINNSLDPTDPVRAAAMLLMDAGNYAQLLKVFAACSDPGNPSVYGLSVGIMFCLKQYIRIATHIYATGLNNTNNLSIFGFSLNYFVKLYQSTCFLAALAIFGARIMAMQTTNLKMDIFNFGLKMCFALFLITQSPAIFDTMVNVVGEGIEWVTSLISVTSLNSTCWPIDIPVVGPKPALLIVGPLVDPAFDYAEYDAWHLIDCVFLHVFGAGQGSVNFVSSTLGISTSYAIPGGDNLIYASMMPVIAATLFTSTLGFIAAMMGLSVFGTIISFITRAMFLVLTSYLTLALFSLLTPFVAPIIVFQAHIPLEDPRNYTGQLFKRWTGILTGAIIQPIIIMGYISFSAVMLDAFVDGDISTDTTIQALFSGCTPDDAGDDLCTFHQLFKPLPDWTIFGVPSPTVGNYNYMKELSPVIAHMKVIGDPQLTSNNCAMIDRVYTYVKQTALDSSNQVENKATGPVVTGPDRMKTTNMRVMKLGLMLITYMVIVVTLYQLMDVIPGLATRLGGAGLTNLWKGVRDMPLIGMIKAAADGGEEGVKGITQRGLLTGGGLEGLTGLTSSTMKGLQGAATSAAKYLVGKR